MGLALVFKNKIHVRRFFGTTSTFSCLISYGNFSVISCQTALKQNLKRFLNEIYVYESV